MNDMRKAILDAIKKNQVAMRPRWHFLLWSALFAFGVILVALTLLYATSLAFFFMRESGVWYAPAFGGRGWYEVFRSLPLLLILLIAICSGLLELLARQYSFAYRRPIVVSLGAILALVVVGGFAIAQTSMHRKVAFEARHGKLPPPMGFLYGGTFQMHAPDDVRRGVIISKLPPGETGEWSFVIFDEDAGTSTVFITPRTRLPYGGDFNSGDFVFVMGDGAGTGTIRAFGVRAINSER